MIWNDKVILWYFKKLSMIHPCISVLMPVFNTCDYLKYSIESILSQSFYNFEFIILDDGSTDGSYQVCKKYSLQDKRIKLYKNNQNMWIAFSRKKLIELSTSWYIACQDSDDISEYNRLQKQYNFLEKNKKYAVVSSNNSIIDSYGIRIWERLYSNNIQKNILKKSPISHGSSLFRKSVFLEVWWYDETLNLAEDYDLWLKVYAKWYNIWVLNDILYNVRIRDGQTKQAQIKDTLRNTLLIQKRAIKQYGYTPSISDRMYMCFENMLLYFPKFFIWFLFRTIFYKK